MQNAKCKSDNATLNKFMNASVSQLSTVSCQFLFSNSIFASVSYNTQYDKHDWKLTHCIQSCKLLCSLNQLNKKINDPKFTFHNPIIILFFVEVHC